MLRSFALLLLLTVALAPSSAASLPRTELERLCFEAEQLFSQAQELHGRDREKARELWQQAAARYERLRQEGEVENGWLYYNLANTYFRLEDIGRAIANYRRAQRYIPHDEKLLQNLAYARSRCRDAIAEAESARVLKTLFFWHYDIAQTLRERLFLAFLAGFWLAALAALWSHRPWLRWALGGLGLLVLVFGVSIALSEYSSWRQRPGVVVSAEVVARKGNGESYAKSFTEPLHAGTEFSVLDERGAWYEVRLADKRSCWLPQDAVELIRR
jgi:tetratricopeptide (TPR) repeat protein